MKVWLVFFMLVFSAQGQAANAEALIQQYLADFAQGRDLAGYFVEKPQFIFGQHIHMPASAREASEFILGIRSKLADAAYGQSDIETFRVLVNIDSYSLLVFSLTRHKLDGTTLDKVCSTYGILKAEDGYKILSWQPSKLNEQGNCF